MINTNNMVDDIKGTVEGMLANGWELQYGETAKDIKLVRVITKGIKVVGALILSEDNIELIDTVSQRTVKAWDITNIANAIPDGPGANKASISKVYKLFEDLLKDMGEYMSPATAMKCVKIVGVYKIAIAAAVSHEIFNS